MGEEQFFIGIDLGGTNCRVALLNGIGEVIEETQEATPAHESPKVTLDLIAEMIRRIGGAPLAVGAGVPGIVEAETGTIAVAPNLPQWNTVRFAERLGKRVSLPVFVGNDVNMVAWGEHTQGAAVGRKNVLCITIGTGVGGGLILNGKLYTGRHGAAGEIGHMVYEPGGILCGCGNRGCIEKYAGRDAIIRVCRNHLEKGEASIVAKRVNDDLDKLNPKVIAECAREGDRLCRDVYFKVGDALGTILGSVVNLLDIECIIIGGNISKAGDVLLDPLRQSTLSHTLEPLRDKIEILPALLGEKAGIIGSALWARDNLRKQTA